MVSLFHELPQHVAHRVSASIKEGVRSNMRHHMGNHSRSRTHRLRFVGHYMTCQLTFRFVSLRYVILLYDFVRYVTLRYVTIRYVNLHYMTSPTFRFVSLRLENSNIVCLAGCGRAGACRGGGRRSATRYKN